jgi:hypothetical protein
MAAGTFSVAKSAEELAAMLTNDLYAATHDKHLGVAVVRDAPPTAPTAETNTNQAKDLDVRRSNGNNRNPAAGRRVALRSSDRGGRVLKVSCFKARPAAMGLLQMCLFHLDVFSQPVRADVGRIDGALVIGHNA